MLFILKFTSEITEALGHVTRKISKLSFVLKLLIIHIILLICPWPRFWKFFQCQDHFLKATLHFWHRKQKNRGILLLISASLFPGDVHDPHGREIWTVPMVYFVNLSWEFGIFSPLTDSYMSLILALKAKSSSNSFFIKFHILDHERRKIREIYVQIWLTDFSFDFEYSSRGQSTKIPGTALMKRRHLISNLFST